MQKILTTPLLIRAIGTLIYGTVFILLVLKGDIALLTGIMILSAIAWFEFFNLMTHAGYRPYLLLGFIAAICFSWSAYLGTEHFPAVLTAVLMISIIWAFGSSLYLQSVGKGKPQNIFANWAVTSLGMLYSGVFLAHAILIRALERGASFLLMVVLSVAACDTAAYLFGKALGRRKFFPHTSPKKTWEGAAGGLLFCILVALLSNHFLKANLNPFNALIFGFLIGVFVILGDLFESMLKRTAGVKDTGKWIPEQGGLLDVMDGFLFAVVISYIFLTFTLQV